MLRLRTARSPNTLYMSGTPSALSNPLERASGVTDSPLLELLTVTRPAPRHCVRTTHPFKLPLSGKRSPSQDLSFVHISASNGQEPRAAELGEVSALAYSVKYLSRHYVRTTAAFALLVGGKRSPCQDLSFEHKSAQNRQEPRAAELGEVIPRARLSDDLSPNDAILSRLLGWPSLSAR